MKLRFSALGLLWLVSACAEKGDFGRPKDSAWNEKVLPLAGSVAARLREEPVSSYHFTDDETELRDRAWRFLMPAQERSWFYGAISNLAKNRILPVSWHPTDKTLYHRNLIGGFWDKGFASPASRYRRLSEDIEVDQALMEPFARIARPVLEADRVRLKMLNFAPDISEDQTKNALARVAENRCLIAWVRVETFERAEAYRYSLDHLVIEMPQNEALPAERSLREFERHRNDLDHLGVRDLNTCAGSSSTRLSAEPTVRFMPNAPGRLMPNASGKLMTK